MALTGTSAARTPMWGKSIAAIVGAAERSNPPVQTSPNALAPRDPRPLQTDDNVLALLGIRKPPSDPNLMAEFLLAEDKADGEMDADNFARGIRRAVRLNLAIAAGLHRRGGLPWKVWVERTFRVGYACFNRYHVAAEIQLGLLSRGLPSLANENQSRAIGCFRKHEKFLEALAGETFREGFPPAKDFKLRLQEVLGARKAANRLSPRIKLHRILERLLTKTAAGDDPPVEEALTLLRRAVTILESGPAS